MTGHTTTHEGRVVRRHAGAIGYVWIWSCGLCGAASPASTNRDVAVMAQRAHLTEAGEVR